MPRTRLTSVKVKVTILPNDEKSLSFSIRVNDKEDVIKQVNEFLKTKL